MRFEWDDTKNRRNLRKHDVRFETAALVFDDPFAITQRDLAFDAEERWITVGTIGPGSILLVVHGHSEIDGEEVFASSPRAPLSPTKGKLMRKLTRQQKRDIRAVAAKKDRDIDFSDVPPVLDWRGAEIGKFYRPAKKPVTMRLDSDVLEWLKADGRGYQTKANWLLRHAMLHFTAGDRLAGRGSARRVSKPAHQKRKG
jgi:uncharacterized DUF497 family protein/uncharacterized protein (DUF4415 family)